jgi:UPF0176 protein
MTNRFQIITFYEFKDMHAIDDLFVIRDSLRELMRRHALKGTMILAEEGFNATVCGEQESIAVFIEKAEEILGTRLSCKTSFHEIHPFRRADVKIKPEIVTLKRKIDINLGEGTHVNPLDWNQLITDPEVTVLDTRNRYEYRSGSFHGAIDPSIGKFSDLPEFVTTNLDPKENKRIATFCTGGIRCEKFVPYLRSLGFQEVYQLDGGILKYLEVVNQADSLWRGECFVFDDRITVDTDLKKGVGRDHSRERGGPDDEE